MKIHQTFLKMIFASIILMSFSSCGKPFPPFFYETTAFTLYNADNSGSEPVSVDDSAHLEAYAIQVYLSLVLKDHEGADINESDYRNEDSVVDFSITSSDTINGILPGAKLNDFFHFSSIHYNSNMGGNPITPENCIEVFSNVQRNAEQWNASTYLLLMDPPASGGNYTFVLTASFSDGRILSDSVNVNLY